MKKSLLIGLIILAFIKADLVLAQQKDSVRTQVQKQLEQTFEELDNEDGLAGEQLAQFLEDLAANPINLNSAGIDEFLQIPGFNLKVATEVINYRKAKPFETKIELLKVKGIGKATYNRLSPYVTVGGASSRFKDMYRRSEYWLSGRKIEYISRYQQELQDQEGYVRADTSGGYLGSQGKFYQRLKMTSRHLSVNLTQEKDAGEELKSPTGFDYNSGHIALTENGKLKDLVIGDYSLSFGQGLVLWTGGAFGKGREVVGTTGKNERGLRGYSSAQETDFFRGIAATYGEMFEVTGFYSSRKRTASVISGDTTRFPSSSGFHRTQSELDRKNNIDQMTVGGRLRVNSRFGFIGATAYHNEFSSFIAKGTSLNNVYDFEGKANSVMGVDYRGFVGAAIVYGEWARSENGGSGGVIGMEASLGFKTNLTMHYRRYTRDFQSFLGDGFGESSSAPQNEVGFYVGLKHELNETYTLAGYVDQYRFPEPRTGINQSTEGFDVLGLVEANFNSKLNAYILLRSEIKGDEYSVLNNRGLEEVLLGENKRASVRMQGEYQVSKQTRLRSRVEFTRNKSAGENWGKGFLIYQDIRFQPARKLQIDARVTLFDTQSFDTRVYQFENDLLYVLSNVMLSGQGQRSYVVIKYEALSKLDIWLKYSVTYFENVHAISSGLSEIKGQKKNTIGLQVRLSL